MGTCAMPSNNKICGLKAGFTLVEMMVALFILSFSILGFSGLILTSIQMNLRNDLRNTAVRLTKERVEWFMARRIEDVVSQPTYPRNEPLKGVAGGTTFPFFITENVTDVSTNLKRIEVTVQYTFRGDQITNNSVIFKHKAI